MAGKYFNGIDPFPRKPFPCEIEGPDRNVRSTWGFDRHGNLKLAKPLPDEDRAAIHPAKYVATGKR